MPYVAIAFFIFRPHLPSRVLFPMLRLRIDYRGRRHLPSVSQNNSVAARSELHWLQTQDCFLQELWSYDQFEEIIATFQSVYARTVSFDAITFSRFRRSFKAGTLALRIPHWFAFHALVAFESFRSTALVLNDFSLQEAQSALKRLLIVGSSTTPAVFAFNKIWSLPPSVVRPAADFLPSITLLQQSHLLHSAGITSKEFESLWAAVTAASSPEAKIPKISFEAFHQRWSLLPARSKVLEAHLAALELQHDPAHDLTSFTNAWTIFTSNFKAMPGANLPPTQVFNPEAILSYRQAPSARAPRHYADDATALLQTDVDASVPNNYWCQICNWSTASVDAWQNHCQQHDGVTGLRRLLLASSAAQWPHPVHPKTLRHCAQQYASRFWEHMASTPSACASCAVPNTEGTLLLYDLRNENINLSDWHALLTTTRYLQEHASLYPPGAPGFLGLPQETLLNAGVSIPFECHSSSTEKWLLHIPSSFTATWVLQASNPNAPLHVYLCNQCSPFLLQDPPRLPPSALANGNLCLPMPTVFTSLTFAERVFLARGFTVRRLHSLPARSAPQHRQKGLLGNTIAFPQNSADIFSVLPRHPAEAAELLTVFFVEANTDPPPHLSPYQVRRAMVRDALLWLRQHNPFYADITISDENLQALPDPDIHFEGLNL